MKRLAVVCLLVSALASCGSDDKAAAPTDAPPEQTVGPTDSVATTDAKSDIGADGEILSREAVAAFVITTVRANGEQGLDPAVVADAVVAQYPSVAVRGYALDADESGISIMSTMPNDKDLPSAENPYVFAVAVADTSGSCVGVVAYGFPTPDQTFTLKDPAACTATEVVDQFIAQL